MQTRWRGMSLGLVCWMLVAACGSPIISPVPPSSAPASTGPAPAADQFFTSDGGGEPRSAGYWLRWNSCAEGNRADVARANGGRAAGWIILDDLLADPGMLVGPLGIKTCGEAIALLRSQDTSGQQRPADEAYALGTQLLAAQLNLAAGAESCPAVEEAVQAGQALLLSLAFDGSGSYLDAEASVDEREVAAFLVNQLQAYNSGALCLP